MGMGSRRLSHQLSWAVVMAVAVAWPLAACAGSPIYKCRGANGDMMYTDTACKGGEKLEIDAGDADPRAIERLARERQASSERFARQQAAIAAEAAQRRTADLAAQPAPARVEGTYCEWCGGWGGYVLSPPPPQRPPPLRPSPRPSFLPSRPLR
jgi:hypothetical protein